MPWQRGSPPSGADVDGDGLGDPNVSLEACLDPSADGETYVNNGDDSQPNCAGTLNGDGSWNDFVEPQEFAAYWQNTFEVPWMVINAGIRIDGVNYKTKVWADQHGDYSAYKPWLWRDCGVDGWCPDDNQYPNLGILYPSQN